MTTLAMLRPPRTSPGLESEAKRLVLPAGVVATGAPAVLAVAKAGLGVVLDPWQQGLARIIFAKKANGELAAETVGISIPRQAGKTFAVAVLIFCFCLVRPGVTVAWTAHHNKVMLETFRHLRRFAQDKRARARVAHVRQSAEDRSIEFVNGSRIVMAARESGALRGVDDVAVLVLDEAQILSEDAMSDILPTQNVAENALTIMMGTPPRPKDPGEVFALQRQLSLEAEAQGVGMDGAAWVEFGADDDADSDDHEQWQKGNPSFPHRTPLRAINKLRKNLTEDNFRREALGIWDDKANPAVIAPGVWAACADPESAPVAKFVLGLDVSPDRSHASVAFAGVRGDDLVHVELDELRAGVGWVVPWIVDRCARNSVSAVVVDEKGPAASLVDDLRAAKVRVVTTRTDDMADACADFYDAAEAGELRHIGQPQLTGSMNSARKRSIGDRWAWNRKNEDSDITPIVAATLAHWGVLSRRVKDSQARSGRRVVTL